MTSSPKFRTTIRHVLRNETRLADLFGWIAQAADLHAAHDELWSKFKDGGKGTKWQVCWNSSAHWWVLQ